MLASTGSVTDPGGVRMCCVSHPATCTWRVFRNDRESDSCVCVEALQLLGYIHQARVSRIAAQTIPMCHVRYLHMQVPLAYPTPINRLFAMHCTDGFDVLGELKAIVWVDILHYVFVFFL